MASWLGSRSARILTLLLLGQIAVFYGFSRSEKIAAHRPLADFSMSDNSWSVVQDVQLDQETLDVLKADDILSRVYVNNGTGQMATLFVAYFETQRTGKAPHSPKNCLPGSGWAQTQSGTVEIPVRGEATPIKVNRYIVARGQNQSVVLYWYQARNRVIASEYSAKIYTVEDAIRYNRSDTSLVRVVVGVDDGNIAKAVNTATSFVEAFFQPLKEYLPS
ncbi:MAG TPA: EpsI family protein [Bryobacteraceae bacterium]|jgi:EpsI family protein